MDKDLFQRVIPWQCLGSVWSRRGSGADIQARDHLLRLSDIISGKIGYPHDRR